MRRKASRYTLMSMASMRKGEEKTRLCRVSLTLLARTSASAGFAAFCCNSAASPSADQADFLTWEKEQREGATGKGCRLYNYLPAACAAAVQGVHATENENPFSSSSTAHRVRSHPPAGQGLESRNPGREETKSRPVKHLLHTQTPGESLRGTTDPADDQTRSQ
jgi:hypothetical protein